MSSLKSSLAVVIAGLLMLSAVAAAVVSVPGPASSLFASGNASHDMAAMDHAAAESRGARAHASHPLEGQVPTQLQALSLESRSQILIKGDKSFNPANGIRSGTGTPADPYLIEGYSVETIIIADTTKSFEIRDNYVSNILILDWTGTGGVVHHNYISALRTNRNVARTGDATSALITLNTIGVVQEIRHYDGEFSDNTVGDPSVLKQLIDQNAVVLNIAGGNGADYHGNTVYGGVDMKLHGHHHTNTPDGASHNHGATCANEDKMAAGSMNASAPYACVPVAAHDERFVNLRFHDNHVIDPGFGFRYNDLNHAGDDRTATSEQEPQLAQPHHHFTTVSVDNNTIEGAGLRVQVFDAADTLHLSEMGHVHVENNVIKLGQNGDAVTLSDVRDALVEIHGNKMQFTGTIASKLASGAGIALLRFKNSTIVASHNAADGFTYGIRAHDLDARTSWSVPDNSAGDARYPVYYDSSVKNAPGGSDAKPAGAHDHGSGDGNSTATGAAGRSTDVPVDMQTVADTESTTFMQRTG